MRHPLALVGLLFLLLATPSVAQTSGERLFTTKACIGCHILKGHPGADGTMGQDLSKFFKAKPPRDPKALAAFIQDPRSERPDTPMPSIGLSKEEAEALTTYVLSPRPPKVKP